VTLVLVAIAVVMLALPRAARRLGRRMVPADWARITAGLLVVGFVALEVALVLLSLPTLLQAVGVPGLANACRRMLGELAPGGVSVGWSAAILALVLPALALDGLRRSRNAARQMRVEAWLGVHEDRGGAEVVVLPTRHLLAYSVAGDPPQIVISRGLVKAIPREEVDAIVRHERAHLRHGHARYLRLASALERAVPFCCPSTRALRVALERWADEDAAGESATKRATVRRALFRMTGALDDSAVAAFTSAGMLVERAAALERPPVAPARLRRVTAYGTVLAFIGALVIGVAAWAAEANMMLGMARFCPMS
jgi:hypothetical protein